MHVAETERSENTYKLMYIVHCLQAEAMSCPGHSWRALTCRRRELHLDVEQGIAPGPARRYAPPRRRQFDGGKNRGGSTSVRGRVRSPHISGGRRWLSCRAAGSQRAYSLSSCAMGQTDGRITLFQNAP